MQFKKFGAVLVCVSLVLVLASCSLIGGSANYKEGLEALNDGDYEYAEECFEEAIQNGESAKKLEKLYDIVSNYNNAQSSIDEDDYYSAKQYFDLIPKAYRAYEIKDDIDDMKDIMEEYEDNVDSYNKAHNYYKSKLYEEAKREVAGIDTKYLNSTQKKNVETIMKYSEGFDLPNQPVAQPVQPVYSDTSVKYTVYVANVAHSIYLRSAPAEVSSNIITTINLGTGVGYIENVGGGWTKINYNGVIGYAKSQYLSTYRPSGSSSGNTYMTVYNVKHSIYLRSSAKEVSGNIICEIPVGSVVRYLGVSSNGFHKISWNGRTGYSKAIYLR